MSASHGLGKSKLKYCTCRRNPKCELKDINKRDIFAADGHLPWDHVARLMQQCNLGHFIHQVVVWDSLRLKACELLCNFNQHIW
jgi:hypothetical protein